jgi:DNA-binding beta-propeller fold protein YncE
MTAPAALDAAPSPAAVPAPVPHRLVATVTTAAGWVTAVAVEGRRVYAVHSEPVQARSTLLVLDRGTHGVVATLDLGWGASSIVVSGERAYVFASGRNWSERFAPPAVVVVDRATDTVYRRIAVEGEYGGVLGAPDGGVYVLTGLGLRLLDAATDELRPAPAIGGGLVGVTSTHFYSNYTSASFSAGLIASDVVIVPRAAGAVGTSINIHPDTFGAVAATATHAYLQVGFAVRVLDRQTHAEVARIGGPVPNWYPDGLAATADGRRVYVVGEGVLSQIDPATNTLAPTVDLPELSGELAVSPDGSRIYAPLAGGAGGMAVVEAVLPLHYRDVQVTAGSAPDWLVSRYTVACTYRTPNGDRECGSAVLGPDGGVVGGQVSDEGGAFPSSVQVAITVDFAPGTGLPGFVQHVDVPVTATGASYVFEPNQVLRRTLLVFDLRPTPLETDYLLLRWRYTTGVAGIASGQKTLIGDELRRTPVAQYEIVVVPDPLAVPELHLDIDGRYQDEPIARFSADLGISAGAVVLTARRGAGGYELVAG